MKGYKTFVESQKMSRNVQKKAFKLGYIWNRKCKETEYYSTDKPFLFFNHDGYICYCEYYDEFLNDGNEYISAQDFLALPEPKQAFDLQPFERVLVRDWISDKWRSDIFSHSNNNFFVCVGGPWLQIARYEGNERYLGTTDDMPEAWKA